MPNEQEILDKYQLLREYLQNLTQGELIEYLIDGYDVDDFFMLMLNQYEIDNKITHEQLIAMYPNQHTVDYMCPNCVTPWKCNGPHIPESES